MSLEIRIEGVSGPQLVSDYLAGREALAPFFAGFPWDPEAYRRKAEEVEGRFDRSARARMAEAIRPASPRAAERLARLVDEGGVLVTTGQQAGLFGGPLFTVHKALSAVRLAEALEGVLGRPALPLFWVASDDHDWDEVRRTAVLDVDNRLRRLELPASPDGASPPMSRRPLGEDVEPTLAQLRGALPDTDFSGELLEALRRAYRPERTVAAAFADLLVDLLAPFDVLLVDSAHPRVKELAVPVLLRELEGSEAHEERLRRQTERLRAAGYHAQVPILPGATNVFLDEEEGGRERLIREDGRLVLRRSGRPRAAGDVLARVEREPERFSPNVLLRPVVETAIFPTVAYVAGPGELSYFAQIGCLFRDHGFQPPLVFPRFSVTLIEGKVRKVLDKFDLPPEELAHPMHEVAGRILRDDLPEPVREAVGGLRRSIGEGYGRLESAARGIDPTLKGPIGSARGAAFHELEQVERKIVHHLKVRREVELEQLEKAAANLFPEGQPQERILNPFQYLVRYGRGLLAEVATRLEVRLDRPLPRWRGPEC